MMKPTSFAFALVFSALAFACGNSPPANTGGTGGDTSGGGGGGGTASGGVDAQIAQGKSLYAENCASCHGANGEGKGAPAVVGKAALPLDPPSGAKQRKGQFKTAADVFEFTKKTMPPGAGGSLKDDEYWAILAFDLKANGVALDKKLDASNAASVHLR